MTNSQIKTNQQIRKLNLLSRAQDFELKKREAFFANLVDIINQEAIDEEIVTDLRIFINSKENPFPQTCGATGEELESIFNETFEEYVTDETVNSFLADDDILPWEQSETMTEVSLPLDSASQPKPGTLVFTESPNRIVAHYDPNESPNVSPKPIKS